MTRRRPPARRTATSRAPLALALLAGCALAQSSLQIASELPDAAPGLTFEQANTVRPKDPTLRAAIEARRGVTDSLAAIKYRLTDAVGSFKDHTVMVLRPTRHGLQYFQHAATPYGFGKLHEAGLSLFGVATLVYWVSFLPDPPVAWNVSIEQGRLFSADSGFVIRQVDPTGDVTRTRCEPGRRVAASTLHASLHGDAIELACSDAPEGETGIRRDIVYLERYGEYVPSVNYEKGGGVATKFQIVAVTVR